ncbi:MAG: hypothetical protein KJ052_07795 [Candidatus Hydrogenedentes bacterium]|nr:hypothetical protein [Candidatus Hydrogenedentota bacterium]
MSSRKRWNDIYAEDNPFRLPQTIARRLNEAASKESGKRDKIRYVWLYMSEESQVSSPSAREERQWLDSWLSVVDEASAAGAQSLKLSFCGGTGIPKVIPQIAIWAGNCHNMTVDLYIHNAPVPELELAWLKDLTPEKVRVFVENASYDAMRYIEKSGMVLLTEDQRAACESAQSAPRLPGAFTCAGPGGALYTCGLALGDEDSRPCHVIGQCPHISDRLYGRVLPR